MNRCPSCGAQKSSATHACRVCGLTPRPRTSTPSALPLSVPTDTAPREAPRRSHRRAVGVLVLSLAILVGSTGYLLGRATHPGGILSAAPQPRTGGGVFTATHEPMPADVIAYLRWLKWFEGERHRMQLNQVFSLAPLATTAAYADLLSEDAPPIQGPPELAVARRFEEKVSPVVKGWGATLEVFDQQAVPAECQALASAYRNGLTTTKSAIGIIFERTLGTIRQLAGQKNKEELAQPTLSWLQSEKAGRTLSHQADSGFATANAALAQLRSRYREVPPDLDNTHFQIVAEDARLPLTLSLPGGLLRK